MRTRHHPLGLLAAGVLGCALIMSAGCGSEEGLKVKRLSKTKGDSGDFVTIHGSGFQDGARDVRVFFGNQRAKVRGFDGDTKLIVEVPGGHDYGKTVDVELIFEPGGSKTLPDAWQYVPRTGFSADDLTGGKTKPE